MDKNKIYKTKIRSIVYFFSLSLSLVVVILFSTGCARKLIYGKDFYTTPKLEYFRKGINTTFDSTQKILENLGYQVQRADIKRGKIITGWVETEPSSHYVNVFDRKDYGISDGAYYRVVVDIHSSGFETKVAVSTMVKSIAGPLESSGEVERKVINRLREQLRSADIELTNVGMEEK